MRWLLVVACGVAGIAWAQVDESYALPVFPGVDAGVPPVVDVAPVPFISPADPVPSEVPAKPRVIPTPVWGSIGGSISATFTGGRDYMLWGDTVVLFHAIGTPVASPLVPGAFEGWVLQAGPFAGVGRGGGPLCEGASFCATRVALGGSVKGGWAQGIPRLSDGVTRLFRMYFGQLEVAGARYGIASAPLSPGVGAWEMLLRTRVGVHLTPESSTSTAAVIVVAAVVEAILFSPVTQGVSFGVTAGLAW